MPSPAAGPAQAPSNPAGFGKMLNEAIQQVNDVQNSSQGELHESFSANESDLHSVMIALEKADLSFQMMMAGTQTRSFSAYQEINEIAGLTEVQVIGRWQLQVRSKQVKAFFPALYTLQQKLALAASAALVLILPVGARLLRQSHRVSDALQPISIPRKPRASCRSSRS